LKYNATNDPPRFGLSFLGAKWSEPKLIGLAYAFEQRTMARDDVQPMFIPRTEIKDVVEARLTGEV
jgi:amidase